MTSAVFRAEFLRALPLWPWLMASHAIAVIAGIAPSSLTGEAGIRTDLLGAIASWSVGILSLALVVRSLWEENPNRSEHFLATRPIRFAALLKGKATGLFILVLLPFLLTEAVMLMGKGQPAAIIGIGTLEALVMLLVFIGVAFAAVWCWSKRSQIYIGLPLALGVIITTAVLLDRVPSLRFSDSPYLRERLASLPFMLCGLLTLGVAAAFCALIFRRDRRLRRVFLFAALVGLVPAVLLPLVRIKPDAAKRYEASLVHLTLSNREMGDRLANWIEVEPPQPDLAKDADILWSVDSLKLNGQRAEPSPGQRLGDRLRITNSDQLWNHAVRAALHGHFGDAIHLPPPRGEDASFPAVTALPGNHDPTRTLDLELGLRGTILTWQVVADLPVKEKAEARWQNTRWAIRASNQGDNFISIQLVQITPYLWLSNFGNDQLSERILERYFLIRDDGQIIQLSGWNFGMRSDWRRTSLSLRERETSIVESSPRFMDEVNPEPGFLVASANYRLVIVRGIPTADIAMTWKTPTPLPCTDLWTPSHQALSEPPPDPRAGTAIEWLRDHPAPASGATDEVARAWLDELIPRIGNRHTNDQNRQLKAAVGSLMKEHPGLVIKTMKELSQFSTGARGVFGWAVMDHTPRDYFRKMTVRDFDQELYGLAVHNGWQGDLTGVASQLVRMGFGWQAEESLTFSPKEAGLSEAEWRDFFRLYPKPDAFRALAGVVLPREELEKQVDRLLEDYDCPLPNPHIDPLLELALARGRSEAPRWLRDGIRRKQAISERYESVWIDKPIRKWFAVPSHLKTEDEVVGWFLGNEPDRYAFDPASGKFHLR
ncbi:hypothetical protein [Luteolibacter soli]|uniref:ABC transporter permease n=1 Tax=Luteolibacter soli TaxID=3135280 RepID=A0ABU9ATP6_9BACT